MLKTVLFIILAFLTVNFLIALPKIFDNSKKLKDINDKRKSFYKEADFNETVDFLTDELNNRPDINEQLVLITEIAHIYEENRDYNQAYIIYEKGIEILWQNKEIPDFAYNFSKKLVKFFVIKVFPLLNNAFLKKGHQCR